MNKKLTILFVLAVIMGPMISTAAPSDYLSPIDITASKSGRILYIAAKTGKKIIIFDRTKETVAGSIKLSSPPSGLTLSPDEKIIYVSTEEPDAEIQAVDIIKKKVLFKVTVGHTAMSPRLSPDGKTLYVCNRFNNSISIIDIPQRKEVQRIAVTREPVAQVLTGDGRFLFVANHLPTGSANVDHMTSVIDIIDTTKRAVVKSIPLPNGAIDLRGICMSHDSKFVYVPSILARFLVPTTQIERGWINTHAMNLIDVEKQELYHTVLLDDVDLGAANPWGIACSQDGKYICVAHSATHEVSLIDRKGLFEKLAKAPKRDPKTKKVDYESSSKNPANDLSFLTGIRKRVKLKGIGPRGLIVTDNTAYTTEYFSDSLGKIPLAEDDQTAVTIPIGPKKEPDTIRTGEIFFNDASLCFQQWQSCSTCHPDARTDAVNWDLLNDDIGNPKSTKSLLLSHETPPVMITGVRDKAETAVRKGIQFIQFAVPPEDKASAIDEYLKSLKPIPSPRLHKGKLTKSAKRGQVIFRDKAGCAECHSGPYFTDMKKYNIGVSDGMEKDTKFDTPTLIEVWRTAPYLYDGRAATMMDVFTKYNTNNLHGTTTKLSKKDLEDLVEFVMSL